MNGETNPTQATLRRAHREDLAAVQGLLNSSSLPIDGVADSLSDYIVAERGSDIVAAIGLERYGSTALLRSAVVRADERGTGIGARLVAAIADLASENQVEELYLLTTTAEEYFPRFGFARVGREEVPEAVKQSMEFRGACPATAVAMRRRLHE